MPLFNDAGSLTDVIRPNQKNGAGDEFALAIEDYSGVVEGTIERRSALEGFVPMRAVRGTTTLTDYAIGEADLQKVVVGEAPKANPVDFSKASITVDTVINARAALPLLDVFQTSFDARREIGLEHGKKIAKFRDQAFFIQAAKAALLTESRFSGGTAGKPKGHKGGNLVTLGAAGDAQDPAKLYAAFSDLFVKMEEKDVIPREDDVMIALRPQQFYTLQDCEQIVNGTYVTASGTRLDNVAILKAYGCPVISSNNIPNIDIDNHELSNARNGNAYDGDFTKLVGLAFSPRALLAGETIPLTSDVWYNKEYKSWLIDSHLSFAVTPNRAEYAGAIYLP